MKTSKFSLPKTIGHFTGTAAVCLLLVAGASGVHAERNSLVENSPFVWEGFVPPEERRAQRREDPPPEPPEDDPLDRIELRGITVMGGETYVSLHDPDNDESFWLAAGESEAGYTVTEYEGSDSVRVRRGDRERSVTLKETQVAELSPEDQRRQQEQRQRGRGRGGSEEEAEQSAERLREAAQELRRRRAIRGGGREDGEN